MSSVSRVASTWPEKPAGSKISERANVILDELSKKMSMSREAIELICSNLFFDYTVEQLYRFWQHHRMDIEPPAAS